MALKDISGRRFGRLVVKGRGASRRSPSGAVRAYWFCECDCGRVVEVMATNINSGKQFSCGCLLAEIRRVVNITHGMRGTSEYKAWTHLVARGTKSNLPYAADYVGRGIGVCREWRESFTAFYADVGPRPGPEYSIDRIDNDRGYEPGNVRWATRSQQSLNTRRTVMAEIGGVRKPLALWADQYGVRRKLAYERVRTGWAALEALTTPNRVRGR